MLDLGAAASNPDAKPVSPAEEIARLEPVVAALKADGTRISIDSFAPETQEWALAQNVDVLNDILGFPDASLYPQLARAHCDLVVMHKVAGPGRAVRTDTDPKTIMARIEDFFASRFDAMIRAGIGRERLILDPGMGLFLGADPEVSLTVLRGLPALRNRFGVRVLVSVSRKGFLRRLVNRPVAEIGPATLAAELFAVHKGADIIRTHEPGPLRDALTVWAGLQ